VIVIVTCKLGHEHAAAGELPSREWLQRLRRLCRTGKYTCLLTGGPCFLTPEAERGCR